MAQDVARLTVSSGYCSSISEGNLEDMMNQMLSSANLSVHHSMHLEQETGLSSEYNNVEAVNMNIMDKNHMQLSGSRNSYGSSHHSAGQTDASESTMPKTCLVTSPLMENEGFILHHSCGRPRSTNSCQISMEDDILCSFLPSSTHHTPSSGYLLTAKGKNIILPCPSGSGGIVETMNNDMGYFQDKNLDHHIRGHENASERENIQVSTRYHATSHKDHGSGKSIGRNKEMVYRAAALQPIAHVTAETIRKPKRKNVRLSRDPQSIAARHRRERISDRIRILQSLVPGGTKMDTASMLEEAFNYIKFLKTQLQAMQSITNPRSIYSLQVNSSSSS